MYLATSKEFIRTKQNKGQMAGLKKLPREYQVVYKEIQNFLWEFTAGDGMDMLTPMYELFGLL